jgi:hypothetical protein
MKKTVVCFALVGLLALSGQAFAVVGTIDNVPAASLLLPYFAVDLDDPLALTTLFSINNASAAPAIAHVTLWTDLSVPTLDFNVYLTGYDVVTFNLRDLFTTGTTPMTSHDDTSISPVGVFSLDTNPVTGVGPGSASCDGQLPLPTLPGPLLTHIRNAHTGNASAVFSGACSGTNQGDNVARGYITIDNVNFCTLDFPGDTGYFITGGAGAANNQNQLWGDYFYVDVANAFAQGETLVHLEADDALGSGNYTYYYRYSLGADQREGLSSTWATRYATGGAFSGGTDLIVWRDAQQDIAPFTCGTTPSPYPLSQEQIVIFDEDENPDVPDSTPFSPALPGTSLIPFPWEANRTAIGGPNFPVPFDFGWLYLNLNTSISGSVVPYSPIVQNWVTTIMDADGLFSVGYDAIQLDNVTDPALATDILLPVCDGAPDPVDCG